MYSKEKVVIDKRYTRSRYFHKQTQNLRSQVVAPH